ncbi:MAG: hypothetical protein WAW82_08430 [Candidatus Lutibacillus vidarii]
MSVLVSDDRRLIGAIGAHESWARTQDRTKRTLPARQAFEQRFLDEAGGDPQRASHLRRAYFARLALKSAQSRRRARELTAEAEAAEAEIATRGGAA